MTKTILRVTTSVGLLLLTAVMVLLAKYLNPVIFAFYPKLSRGIVSVLATATSVLPIPLCELLLAAAVIWLVVSLVRAVLRRRIVRWLTGVLLSGSILLAVFVAVWGLNYYAPPMSERLGLRNPGYSVSELSEATAYYLHMANAYAPQVMRNADGSIHAQEFDALSEKAADGFVPLSEGSDAFSVPAGRAKKLLSSPLQGKIGMTGVFICYTGESCVSTTTYTAALPFTMCHELSHSMAYAKEDEANFAAFLACTANEDATFRYSGYYCAFVYCYNALYDADPAAAQKLQAAIGEEVAADVRASREHYAALENTTAVEVANHAYDGYLKSFSVGSGAASYGEVTDLLLAWYFMRLK